MAEDGFIEFSTGKKNRPFRFFDTRFCDQSIGLLHDLRYQPVKNLFENTMTRLLRLAFISFVCFAHFRMCYVTLTMSLKRTCVARAWRH